MKILLINGSPHEHGSTDTALGELRRTLCAHGVTCETIWLGGADQPDCRGCGGCRASGKCVIDDSVNALAARLDTIDGLVFGSPVYFAGPSGRLTSFMDRLFYSAGAKLAGKVAASVVCCRRGGASAAFERLNQYYLMSNMVVAGSQYWNQVHGAVAADLAKDEEGLQTMRTLGENIAWLLASISVGRNTGVGAPVYEPKLRTNFIR